MVLSVGENLLSTLVVVSLVVVFIAALAHSYRVYAERTNAYEDFNLALDIAERIKTQVLAVSGQPGLLELSSERLDEYSQLLAAQGVSMRVEVRSLDGGLLFSHGPEPDSLGQHLSSPVGVSLPISAVESQLSAKPCELSVQVWRG